MWCRRGRSGVDRGCCDDAANAPGIEADVAQRPLSPPSPLLAELRAVTRDRQRVLYAQQACESQLRAIMDAYHPAPLHLFSTLDRDISLDFIADYPTPAQAGRVGTARMEAFCRRHG